MRSKNTLCAGLGFLLILIAAYFGASIYNSKANVLIDYLNELDNIRYYDPELIPMLNYRAALITMPLILTLIVVETIIVLKSNVRQVKNIAIGLLAATLIITTVAILTLNNPEGYDFSRWGYVWITMGIFIVAGNAISLFIKGNKTNKL